MAEFFGYAERSADSYINWGQISKSMSDMLVKENQIREEKKKALDDETAKLSEYVANNMPAGQHKGAKDAGLEIANVAQNQLLMMTKLLKSGQLNPNDYVRNREKLKADVNTSYTALKNYQERFATALEDFKSGKASAGQMKVLSQAEELGTFTNNGFATNPTTGGLIFGKRIKKTIDGKEVTTISTDPADIITPSALNSMILTKWDKIDANGEIKKVADSMGERIMTYRTLGNRTTAGSITEVLNMTDEQIDKAFKTDEDKALAREMIKSTKQSEIDNAKAILANPFGAASLLLDWINQKGGTPYDLVYDKPDEAKSDSTKINMKFDPASNQYVPELTEEQSKDATDWLVNSFRAQYKRKLEEKTYTEVIQEKPERQQNPYARQNKAERQSNIGLGESVARLVYAKTQEDADQAAQSLGGYGITIEPGRTDNEYILSRTDENGKVVDKKPITIGQNFDETLKAFGRFILGTNYDLGEAQQGAKSTNLLGGARSTFKGSNTIGGVDPYEAQVRDKVYFAAKDPNATANRINTSGTGAKAEVISQGGGFLGIGAKNIVRVTAPNGQTMDYDVESITKDSNRSMNDDLVKFIVNNRAETNTGPIKIQRPQ